MKFKNKGRKIYKTKEKNYYGKSPVGKAFSVGLFSCKSNHFLLFNERKVLFFAFFDKNTISLCFI